MALGCMLDRAERIFPNTPSRYLPLIRNYDETLDAVDRLAGAAAYTFLFAERVLSLIPGSQAQNVASRLGTASDQCSSLRGYLWIRVFKAGYEFISGEMFFETETKGHERLWKADPATGKRVWRSPRNITQSSAVLVARTASAALGVQKMGVPLPPVIEKALKTTVALGWAVFMPLYVLGQCEEVDQVFAKTQMEESRKFKWYGETTGSIFDAVTLPFEFVDLRKASLPVGVGASLVCAGGHFLNGSLKIYFYPSE